LTFKELKAQLDLFLFIEQQLELTVPHRR